MKKFIYASLILLLFANTLYSQDKTFQLQGYLIGQSFTNGAYSERCMMSEVVKMDSVYFMYYTVEDPTQPGYIMYATSTDLTNWTIQDTVVAGVNDTTDRTYVLGGPRLIKTSTGQYRLFYRTSQYFQLPFTKPKYHIRSSVSSDGINFTDEGVRIEINEYDSTSQFIHVGHSEFYHDAGGNLRALITAKDTTMGTNTPDRLYVAQSTDDGLTWTNFVPMYTDCHDPVVIIDSNGTYHAFFTYLNTAFKTVSSPNGAGWPVNASTLYMLSGIDTLTESSSPVKLADLGAVVDSSGNIILTSNYADAPGPWTHIAYFSEVITTSQQSTEQQSSIEMFPNPSAGFITVKGAAHTDRLVVYDMLGKRVYNQALNHPFADLKFLPSGIYLVEIVNAKGETRNKEKFILQH